MGSCFPAGGADGAEGVDVDVAAAVSVIVVFSPIHSPIALSDTGVGSALTYSVAGAYTSARSNADPLILPPAFATTASDCRKACCACAAVGPQSPRFGARTWKSVVSEMPIKTRRKREDVKTAVRLEMHMGAWLSSTTRSIED